MEVIEQLKQLGFSQYEAQAYIALLQESPLNGYELAKASGVPRANIYGVLQRLEETGAVMRLSIPNGARYAPVPSNELLAKLKRRYQQTLEVAAQGLQQIEAPPNLESVLNIRGYAELLDQARAILEQTSQHLLISLWPTEATALAEPLQQALDRGVQITTLCLHGCPQPCLACRGAVFRYAIAPADSIRWLVLVSDGSELLAGEIHSPGDTANAVPPAAAVRTRQKMLINLTGSYIQNSIALASILVHLGDRLFSELDSESIAALNAMHPLQSQENWIERMRHMLKLDQSAPE